MAVNLMVTTRYRRITSSPPVRWVMWMVGAMLVALLLVAASRRSPRWPAAAPGLLKRGADSTCLGGHAEKQGLTQLRAARRGVS